MYARIGSLGVLAFVGLAAVASASDWYVDANFSACSHSDGSPGRPYCTISKALANAQSGDTIHVKAGSYNEHLSPTFDVTLIGRDGAAQTFLSWSGSVFNVVNGVNVSIRGFTIQNGNPGIFLAGGTTLAITDCIITGNSGPGIVASNGPTLSITDCAINGNGAPSGGGGGLQATQAYAVTITGTTFQSNTATKAKGGAILASGGSCTIQDCTFDGNHAVSGQAIYATAGVVLSIESSTFKNHTTGTYGAAIYADDAASAVTIKGSTFSNNVAYVDGGAIYADGIASIDVADSTFDANVASSGGALFSLQTTVSCERCTFHANEATQWTFKSSGVGGGAAFVSFSAATTAAFSDCLFDSNEADATSGLGSGAGALGLASGPSSLVRCRFTGNFSNGAKDRGGGALFAAGTLTATDCEFTGNRAVDSANIPAGPGAILATGGVTDPATLERCTIGGNTTNSTGGGLFIPAGAAVYLTHTIVAGNTAAGTQGAPDVDGFLTSYDWNDFGDTTGLKKLFGPNDLLDVDPLFVNPANGDYSLQSISPCVDSGDPTATPSGPDVGGNPRLLDGDLDGVLVLDRGAREFNNVHLDVSGTPTPGGTLTLATSGTSGLALLLLAGSAPGDLFVHPFGDLFVDLTQPFLLFPFGTIPNSQNVTLDPSMPVPVSFWLQEAAIGTGAGNFSNVVEVDVQ